MVRTLVGALALAAALITAAPAQARTLEVPRDYASLGAAYTAAQSGDTIELAAGVYGPQVVPLGTKTVTFRGLPGNKVRKLDNYASNVTFDGLDIDAGMSTPNGAAFEAHADPGGENVTFKNGRIGNVVDQKGAVLGGTTDGSPVNLVLDNVEFHDVVQVTDGVHNECAFSQAPGLTIRNSTFTNCATMDLFVLRGDWWGQVPYGGITLENNVFGHSVNGGGWHYYGLYWSNGAFQNVRVVNNTFENSVIHSNVGGGPYSGVWANNIGGGWDCLPGVTYRSNIGSTCHGSDRAVSPVSSCGPPACAGQVVPVGWANPVANDFRLTAGSIAIDAGDAAYAPARDRSCRLRDARPDVGAYEFGALGTGCAPGGGSEGPGGGSDGGNGGNEGVGTGGGVSADAAAVVRIRSARLGRALLCRRARKRCPATTRLRLALTGNAAVSVRFERLRAGRKPVVARTQRSLRISARGLRPGRYRLRVTAGAAERTLTLRVRT